jgi:multicomponent Na+:H+ antiporter subunit D
MSADLLLLIFLLTPIFHAMAVGAGARVPALRDGANILFACAYAWLAFTLVDWHQAGSFAYVALARPLPTADFAFAPEPIGLTAAATFAALGALNAPFAGGFFRAMEDKAPARAQVLIALSVGLGCAAALAANLFTFLLCYQAMIVASFPLVAHHGGPEIRRAGQIYFGILLTASIALLLPAMAWTHGLAGRLDFMAGGLLSGKIGPIEADVLLALFAFGFASAGLMPLHPWLPAAMRAPAPAAGLVHSVVVVSVGALGLIKVSLLIFGQAMAQAAIARPTLIVVALGGSILASLIALSKDELKPRLAYATIAQIALCSAGAMIATPVALFAASFQIVAHGIAKTSLYFTAGAVEAMTGRTRASELTGLGKHMPWAFAAFALAALSVSFVPPLAGAWSLLWLVAGAARADMIWVAGLILASCVASFAVLGPLAGRAIFGAPPSHPFVRPDAASVLLILPVAIGGAVSLGLLFLIDPLSRFLGVRLGP